MLAVYTYRKVNEFLSNLVTFGPKFLDLNRYCRWLLRSVTYLFILGI